jgi:hypothetical protein
MLQSFYRAVLPDAGHFCLFLLPEARHVWADSLEGLVVLTEKYMNREGVYFGTAAFESQIRKQANVLALRSLRLDIDAGPEKLAKHGLDEVYATQRDALADSVRFFKATGLAPSYIVSSGAGLHIYFCLDRDVTPEQWLPMAKALAFKGSVQGFKIDASVTEDTARILRPVGAVHHEDVRVKIIKATGKVYAPEELSKLLGAAPAARKYDTSINDDVKSTYIGPPVDAFKVAAKCGALREVADRGGDVQEPHWRAMIGLVKHTANGLAVAHEWSQGYESYNPDDVDQKYEAWATGPTTCAEFSKHSNACSSCEHQGKVKSPIVLGRMKADEVAALPPNTIMDPIPEPAVMGKPWDGFIPHRFEVVASKGGFTMSYYQDITKKDGEEGIVCTPFTHEMFWFSHWSDAAHSDDGAQVTIHKYDDMEKRVKSYEMPIALLASRADLAKKLGEFGIQLTTEKRAQEAMEHYAKAQFQRIKNLSRRVKITDRFGIRIQEDGSMVAVQGSKIIYPDGSIQEAMLGPSVRPSADWFSLPMPPAFTGEWGPEVWDSHINPKAQQYVDFMRKHYTGDGLVKYQLACMLSLASPFMAFVTGGYSKGTELPPTGLTVSMFERDGGRGKSTLMQAAALAYGIPENLCKDQNKTGSTDLGRIAKLSMLGTMPAFFDEMGRIGDKSGTDLISSVANGTGRDRATKDGGLTTSAKWSLICLAATNRSQRDMITVGEGESSAVQYRMLELDMNNMPEFSEEARLTFAADWAKVKNECAGALGAVVHRAICALGAEKVNKLVLTCVDRAARMISSQSTDRFQYRALGAMLALQVLLTKAGLAMFDTKTMIDEFNTANDSAKEYVKENMLPSDGLELLSLALHDMRGSTVVTEIEGYTRGNVMSYARSVSGTIPPVVTARYVASSAMLYVSMEALRKWCAAKHLRDTDLLQPARKAGVLRAIYPSRVNPEDPLKFPAVAPFNLLRGMQESTRTQIPCCSFNAHRLAQHLGRDVTDSMVESNVVQMRSPPPDEAAA